VRVLRVVGRLIVLLIAVVVVSLLVVKYVGGVLAIPYDIWWVMREGGYPVWAQVLGAACFAGVIGYLVYRAYSVGKQRGEWGRRLRQGKRNNP
jgi:hypothetical protein